MGNKTGVDYLSGISFFSELDQAERDILLKSTTIKHYPKRHTLCEERDPINRFMIIIKGWVKLYNLTDDGEEVMIDMMTRNDVLGAGIILSRTKYPFSAAIAENSIVAEIPTKIIEQRFWANPVLAKQIMTIMTQKINRLWVENSHLSTMMGEQRLSCLLLRLSSWMTGKGGTFSLPYDKSIMAAQLGVELSTLSRLFGKLRFKGVESKGSEVKIENFSTLSACCCSQCPIPENQCAGRRSVRKSTVNVNFDDMGLKDELKKAS